MLLLCSRVVIDIFALFHYLNAAAEVKTCGRYTLNLFATVYYAHGIISDGFPDTWSQSEALCKKASAVLIPGGVDGCAHKYISGLRKRANFVMTSEVWTSSCSGSTCGVYVSDIHAGANRTIYQLSQPKTLSARKYFTICATGESLTMFEFLNQFSECYQCQSVMNKSYTFTQSTLYAHYKKQQPGLCCVQTHRFRQELI